MKKYSIIIILIIFLEVVICAQVQYVLGEAQSKKGLVNIDYIKESKGDYIKLSLKHEKSYANIYLPYDLKDMRRLIEKFEEWHKIAVENSNYILNKNIGALSTIRIDFATANNSYEIVFVEKRTGLKITSFDLAQIQAFRDVMTDEKIDNALNAEKRKKEREDSLFK